MKTAAIDRKPEFASEIQDSDCRQSGILIQLKTAAEELTHFDINDAALNHSRLHLNIVGSDCLH
jgi:hypothetical protein